MQPSIAEIDALDREARRGDRRRPHRYGTVAPSYPLAALAEIAIERGRHGDAIALAERAVALPEAGRTRDEVEHAKAVLARARRRL